MANAFANGLRMVAQKRPMAKPPIAQPVMPQPVTAQMPVQGLNPRPPTESGFPTPTATPGVPPVTPQAVRPPSLIQDTLRRRRELGV